MSAWLCRKMTGEYTTRKRTLVALMALRDRVTTHASSVFGPHHLCSMTPEHDHLCFVISRLGFQVLFDTGILSLSMAMGLASGLVTGQCALTLPSLPRHRARVQSASAPSLGVHEPIQFPVSPPPQLQPND